MKKILFSVLIYFFFQVCGCSSINEPDNKLNPKEISWSVDTVYYPNSIQTMMDRIWGSSENNVYLLGHSDESRGQFYHLNKNTWEAIPLGGIYGGPINSSFELTSIIGFSSDKIFISGYTQTRLPDNSRMYESLIVSYNGVSWEIENTPLKKQLFCIWGDAPNNIWAIGNQNTMLHYDGSQWTLDSLDHPGYGSLEISLAGIFMTGNSANGYYMTLYSVINGAFFQHLLNLQNNKWTVVDSVWDKINRLWMSPSGNLYITSNYGVFIWDNGNWYQVFDQIQTFGIHGTSDENIYITTRENNKPGIWHYNGSDWYEYDIGDFWEVHAFFDIKLIGNQIFAVGYGGSPTKTFVLRGK